MNTVEFQVKQLIPLVGATIKDILVEQGTLILNLDHGGVRFDVAVQSDAEGNDAGYLAVWAYQYDRNRVEHNRLVQALIESRALPKERP